MEASLYSLFARGRYCRKAGPASIDSAEDGEKQQTAREERERFAAAAIAFCCRHDHGFKKHFLRKVCCLENVADAVIEIEPKRWSDLLVSGKMNACSFVQAIECKIDADLKPHQNPVENAFWDKGGYGCSLRQAYENSGSDVRYTIIGFPDKLYFPPEKDGIRLAQVLWSDLEEGLPQSGLVQDLAETLGRLGCTDFAMRTIRKIRVRAGFADALRAKQVLAAVRKKLQIHFSSAKDEEILDADYAAIGCWIRSPGHRKSLMARPSREYIRLCYLLNRVANRDEEWIAWFGYEAGPTLNGGFLRSVWLLCADEARVQTICGAFPVKVGICSPASDDERSVVIAANSKSDTGDLDWFATALETASLLEV